MPSGITKTTLNGKLASSGDLKEALSALSDKLVLAEKGGYLFKSLIQDDHLYLGVLPYFINGQRALHHDIDLPEDPFTLIGFINSNGSLGLVFKLSKEYFKEGLTSETICLFREQYIRFAAFLIENDFPTGFEIDIITKQLLVETGTFPDPPENVGELADQS